MRLIDADELKDFFFSETSGTEEIINDLMMKHNLDYAHDVNEDDVMDFAEELLKKVRNVIDTEPTVDTRQIRADVIEEVADELLKLPKIFVDYFDYIAVARITKKLEQLKEQKLRENENCDWKSEIITKEHDEKVIAKFIDEAIEKYKKYNCLICKRKDEEHCTVGECTIAFLEQLKEQK